MSKKSCLLFGEGKTDRRFFDALRKTTNFKHHTADTWIFQSDNISGGHPSEVLSKCIARKSQGQYALCFCDTDLLEDSKERENIDKRALENRIIMIWQDKDLEEEMLKTLYKNSDIKQKLWIGRLREIDTSKKKNWKCKVQKNAKDNIDAFVNSDYSKSIHAALDVFKKTG